MKKMIAVLLTVAFSMMAEAESFKTYNGANLGSSAQVNCGPNLDCSKDTAGAIKIGANSKLATASGALVVTKDQCGTTFFVTGVSATLPAASTVLGCEYDFVAASAASSDINPADVDTLMIASTYASGDATQMAGFKGNHVKLKAVVSGFWELVSSLGSLVDIN